ncbi:MAG: twin-arginine translocase TatA/TatE family subunit [Thermoplasmata archaeon]
MGLLDPGPEVIVLLVIILVLLFGAKKIPELARSLGRAMGEFRRGRMEIERELKQSYETRAEVPQEPPAERAARALNINTKGRDEKELTDEVLEAVDLASKKGAVTVAKALGIDVEGTGVDELKGLISEKLGG